MSNIYRQAYKLVTTKTGGEMTRKELRLVNRAIFPIINLLPKLEPEEDEMLVSDGLLKLARIIEGENHGNKSR